MNIFEIKQRIQQLSEEVERVSEFLKDEHDAYTNDLNFAQMDITTSTINYLYHNLPSS